ncbi:MAG TPA: hypothetical protein VK745_30420 [Polyangiaceae bacterium]|jgi:hypothetical protein|nr:hypothetical protein [Polyangiaceae bacterium]
MVRWDERGAGAFVGSIAIALILASCGGRASSLQLSGAGGDSGGADSSQGGAAAVGGSASRGGAGMTSIGGAAAGAGATSGAGTPPGSDAGPPLCTDNCPEIACPSGQMVKYVDTVCCPFCVACSASDQAACQPSYDCGPAAHVEVLPEQCCPTCVANDPALCMMQIDSANAGANAIFPKYSMQCQVGSDCAGAILSTACMQTCIIAPQASLPALLAELTMVEVCPACPAPNPVTPYCDTPACLNQTCQVPSFK